MEGLFFGTSHSTIGSKCGFGGSTIKCFTKPSTRVFFLRGDLLSLYSICIFVKYVSIDTLMFYCMLPAFCTFHLCKEQPHLEHDILTCAVHLEHRCDFTYPPCSKCEKSMNRCSKCALRTSGSWFLGRSKCALFCVWKTPDVLSACPALYNIYNVYNVDI